MNGPDPIVQLSCSTDSHYMAISRADSTIEFFDLWGSRTAFQVIKVYFNMLNDFVFISSTEAACEGLSFGMDHNLRIWDIQTGQRKGIVSGHCNRIIGAFKIAEKQLITCSVDKTLRLWDTEKMYVCVRTFAVD